MVEYEQIRKVLLIEFCGECALNTCEGCLVSDTFIRMSRRPTKYAPDVAPVTSAEPDSGLESVPAVESGTQPRG